jgi:hypothetical protein
MSRHFTVDTLKVCDELLKIYKSSERLNMIKEAITTTRFDDINLYFFYNGEYLNVDITETELQNFINVYWKDVQESNENDLKDDGYEFIEISISQKLDNHREEWKGFQLEWHENFTNTKQFIEDNKLAVRAKENQSEIYEKD